MYVFSVFFLFVSGIFYDEIKFSFQVITAVLLRHLSTTAHSTATF